MRLICKSDEDNWLREFAGLKPNTVRELKPSEDIIQLDCNGRTSSFEASITDWTIHEGRLIVSFDKDTIRLIRK